MRINIQTYFNLRPIAMLYIILGSTLLYSQTPINYSNIDPLILNNLIQKELNSIRKKAKIEPVKTEIALSNAANDHSAYMLLKKKLTHTQRNKVKKTPKNRVDFYGAQFDRVGENIQLNNLNLNSTNGDKKHPIINTYEKLAKELVMTWKSSRPHYANMINPKFKTSFTSIAINKKGEVYACQLFGSAKYKDKYASKRDTIKLKPYKRSKCWRCKVRPPQGEISILEDSTIVYTFESPKIFWGFLPAPPIKRTRMRFFKPRKDGLAADIIVKSQYTCDSNSNHNGISNVRGILLEPVYKKDFKRIPLNRTQIVLGKVPSYINEEFEVNLVVIQNNRPCSNTMFYTIPTKFEVEVPLNYKFEPSDRVIREFETDTLSKRLYFKKSEVTTNDSNLVEITALIRKNKELITTIKITGLASIEGTTLNNSILYNKRANSLFQKIADLGIDSSKISISASENFNDFRSDIIGTKYESLGQLNDSLLKVELLDKKLSNELEFLLKNHRYVNILFITKREYESPYHSKKVNAELKNAIKKGNINESITLQQIQYSLVLSKKMTFEEVESVEIPHNKKNYKLLHNLALIKFKSQKVTVQSLKEFRNKLSVIDTLRERDVNINTSMAIIDYHLYCLGQYKNKNISFYDTIRKWKYIDKVQQARILLNTATKMDWKYYLTTNSKKDKKYYYNKVKRYISPAKLDIDKTFEIASYYTFFEQYKYALDLSKRKINKTTNPWNLISFLKLIHLTDINLSRSAYLNYFERIRRYSGEKFCDFFNNPALNFQIFDDEKIKQIYCSECGNK